MAQQIIRSKHGIAAPIRNSNNYYILNPLSGNADIISADEYKAYEQDEPQEQSPFFERGYWTNASEEQRAFKAAYLQSVDDRDSDEVQLFFVPHYTCNFACSYCYQDEYAPAAQTVTTDVVDAFFRYIEQQFANRRKYITLFGGEPLLPSENNRQLISYFLDRAAARDLSIAVVTNGYSLVDYIDILKRATIREVQVTLDGTASVHDARRFLKGQQPTFERIVAGVDACLQNDLMVNLRVVIDKENINNLVELAQFAIDRGWTQSPLFKTQIGRNYELHHCNSTPEKLFTRLSLYERLFDLIAAHPHIESFYKPSYSIAKYLSEQGEMPHPLFDACPACKTEWAFDYTGTIYSCTATVGKQGESLGTFYPTVQHNTEEINRWQMRDVLSIEQCKSCNLQLACGGGCGSVAKNKNGSQLSPDCRPVKELLSLGFARYFNTSLES